MEGKINLFECADKSGKRPHFKGFVSIDGVDHEFAVWPAKSGNGFSGGYKPKGQQAAPVTAQQAQAPLDELDAEIPF